MWGGTPGGDLYNDNNRNSEDNSMMIACLFVMLGIVTTGCAYLVTIDLIESDHDLDLVNRELGISLPEKSSFSQIQA